jgi:hypothetical protein
VGVLAVYSIQAQSHNCSVSPRADLSLEAQCDTEAPDHQRKGNCPPDTEAKLRRIARDDPGVMHFGVGFHTLLDPEDLARVHYVVRVDSLLNCAHDTHRLAVLGDQKVDLAATDAVFAGAGPVER